MAKVRSASEEGGMRVVVGDWATLGKEASAIRTEVFVVEQKVPADMEWDEADAQCVHAVAFDQDGVALATGRLLVHAPQIARIGRMATRQSARGRGVGHAVLDALMRAARARGESEVMLHAQLTAEAFYERAGFVARGEVFEEAAIAHIEMTCAL